jgi:F-box domain
MDSLEALPLEIRHLVLAGLPLKDVLSFCLLNKEFQEICRDNSFWRALVWRDFKASVPHDDDAKEVYKTFAQTLQHIKQQEVEPDVYEVVIENQADLRASLHQCYFRYGFVAYITFAELLYEVAPSTYIKTTVTKQRKWKVFRGTTNVLTEELPDTSVKEFIMTYCFSRVPTQICLTLFAEGRYAEAWRLWFGVRNHHLSPKGEFWGWGAPQLAHTLAARRKAVRLGAGVIADLLTSLNAEVMSRYSLENQAKFWTRFKKTLNNIMSEGSDYWREEVIQVSVPTLLKTMDLLGITRNYRLQ